MAIFMLETDSATSTSQQLTSLSSQLDSVAGNVEGYDTSADGFDFASAKSVLAASIKACSTKMKNTSNYIESVVSSHTTFQNNVKFESSEEKAAREAAEKKAAQSKSNSSNGSSSSSSGGGHSSSNGGGYYSTGGSHGTSSSSSGAKSDKSKDKTKDKEKSTEAKTEPKTDPKTEPKTTPEEKEEDTIIKEKEVTDKIEKLSEEDFKDKELQDVSKKILENAKYNEEGYATYNDMYIVSCDREVGTIGDVIEITLKDGSKVKCVVGMNNSEANGTISFAVNDTWKQENEKNITNNLYENIDKVINKTPGQPTLGIYTKEYESNENKWNIVDTKGDIEKYTEEINNKIVQNVDKEKYKDKDLSFAEIHAYALFSGKTDDTVDTASSYQHSGLFTSFKSDSLDATINKIYTEITNGRPVVAQLNGNAAGTIRHFATIVGFKNTVTDPSQLTEKDLLVLDSSDGKIKTMDQEGSMFLTTAKQTHKGNDGYYLRVLKDDDQNKAITNTENTNTRDDNPTENINQDSNENKLVVA